METPGLTVEELSKDRKFVSYDTLLSELQDALGLSDRDIILDAYPKDGGFVFTVAETD